MKIPESLFAYINPLVSFLLGSPLHFVVSDSILLITYTGRKSEKTLTTPVRYLRDGDRIRLFSTQNTNWWRNLRNGATATLLIKGHTSTYRTEVYEHDSAEVRECLEAYLMQFPQDAVYHNVSLDDGRKLNQSDLNIAAKHSICVEATPI